jgi:hypothetical protein
MTVKKCWRGVADRLELGLMPMLRQLDVMPLRQPNQQLRVDLAAPRGNNRCCWVQPGEHGLRLLQLCCLHEIRFVEEEQVDVLAFDIADRC